MIKKAIEWEMVEEDTLKRVRKVKTTRSQTGACVSFQSKRQRTLSAYAMSTEANSHNGSSYGWPSLRNTKAHMGQR